MSVRPDYDMAALTNMQQEILNVLARKKGDYVSLPEIARLTTGYGDAAAQNSIRIHVCRMRKKLGNGVIFSKAGRGYRLAQP